VKTLNRIPELRRRASYPSDDLGFLQRTHPLRGSPFGRLVYMADSIMQPMQEPGFGMHPHANVEVISYVVDGALTHRDSAGNVGVVPAGSFQRITAGTGIQHDETNGTDTPLRMFQIWFEPETRDVAPEYAVIDSTRLMRYGDFALIIDTNTRDGALTVNADASIALGRFARGQQIDFDVSDGRAALLYVVEGAAKWGDNRIGRQDQLRIKGPQRLTLEAGEEALLLLIESAA
jgi:quercetin 2,3-dioxygenase